MKEKASSFPRKLGAAAVNIWETPWSAALIAGFIYSLISIYHRQLPLTSSQFPYYNYLADAFLHGQTWLRLIPQNTLDLSYFNGRFFLYWGPLPAILMMPMVAIFGVNFSDVIFTIFFAMLNVALVAQLLRVACRVEFLHLSKIKRGILVFFFSLGTVFITLAPYGKIWFTVQVVGLTFILLAYLAAFSLKGGKAWFFSGLALSGAMLTRNSMTFNGLFILIYLLNREKPHTVRKVVGNLAWAALPLFLALGFILVYDQVRFGNPLEFGITYHLVSDFFYEDFHKYGYFNLRYIPTNLYYQYIFYPLPLRAESTMGGSLFLLSPVFFGAFFAFRKPRNKIWVWALLGTILLVNIPILLLMGTGYLQFGPRYTLDFIVPLLLLTALGVEHWPTGLLAGLSVISAIQYFMGIGLTA